MSVAEQIIDSMTAAQSVPTIPPSGTERCPLGAIRIGVFFDGTSNSMFRDFPIGEADGPGKTPADGASGPTNIAKLWKVFIDNGSTQKRVYCVGVGTDSTIGLQAKAKFADGTAMDQTAQVPESDRVYDWRGAGFGAGGKARVEWGMKQLGDFFSLGTNHLSEKKLVDTYGFSRGAAIARDFVNTALTRAIDNTNVQTGTRLKAMGAGRGVRYVQVPTYQAQAHIIHEFLGVFDTVASFGAGGPAWADSWAGYNFQMDHTRIQTTVHMVAEDEIRGNFPLTSLFMEPKNGPIPQPGNMKEIWYPGVHSDVGGSYLTAPLVPAVPAHTEYSWGGESTVAYTVPAVPEKPEVKPHLAHITLHDMHKASVKAGVPLSALPGGYLYDIPGDLADNYGSYDGYRAGQFYALPRIYIQSFPSEQYRTMRVARKASPGFAYLSIHYVHDSRWPLDKLFDRQQRTVHYMAPQKG
jgi:hypothetical protein